MYIYCLLGLACFLLMFKGTLLKHERDLYKLRSELIESLDYSENEIKQAHVALIDRVFDEYSKNV